jgi:hypothetical protein
MHAWPRRIGTICQCCLRRTRPVPPRTCGASGLTADAGRDTAHAGGLRHGLGLLEGQHGAVLLVLHSWRCLTNRNVLGWQARVYFREVMLSYV